jgi:hypothetical protein
LDVAWKEVLADGIDDAIAFFLPELAKDRDTSREIALGRGEFPALGAEGDIGKRSTDLSFLVPIKGGKFRKVALFIEQQDGEDKEDFALRMFQTFYRMSDSLKDQVTALAIFTGRAKDRNEYLYSCYGVNLSFRYNTYHVLSQDISELKNDERVFATVVLAARMVIAAKGNPVNREKYVRELLKIMHERDYDIKRRKRIMKFIGNVMNVSSSDISEELRREFYMEWVPISQVQREIAIKDAKEGMIAVAENLLKKGVSMDIIVESTGLNREDILALG